jgi:[ribosomal protein S5]-alanine N-acetyltransferase
MMQSNTNGATDFIIHPLSDPELAIGKIGVYSSDSNEIGFLLARKYWGQGLAREALGAMLCYLFEVKSYEQLTADVDPRNQQCMKLLGRVGFEVFDRKERTWQIGEEWCDSVYLKMRKEDWNTKQGQPLGDKGAIAGLGHQ